MVHSRQRILRCEYIFIFISKRGWISTEFLNFHTNTHERKKFLLLQWSSRDVSANSPHDIIEPFHPESNTAHIEHKKPSPNFSILSCSPSDVARYSLRFWFIRETIFFYILCYCLCIKQLFFSSLFRGYSEGCVKWILHWIMFCKVWVMRHHQERLLMSGDERIRQQNRWKLIKILRQRFPQRNSLSQGERKGFFLLLLSAAHFCSLFFIFK